MLVRRGAVEDARAIFNLVAEHREEGHLLPRPFEEIRRHASRFFVATVDGEIVGCAELAPLSTSVAEVRSLVIDGEFRSLGLGAQLVGRLEAQASADRYRTLCAFTHEPGFFVRHGFSIVPHVWVPEKIQTDCRTCPLFMKCGQYAVVLSLDTAAGPAALDV
jgi:N-acetylglutamate synthase-like GNAT family acetyltransferase